MHLPDDLAQQPNPGRAALESLAIEGYKTGALSHFQASQLLGLSRIEFDGFLKERHIYDHAYGVDDLKNDLETVQSDIERRLNQYTTWLKECVEAEQLSIEPTNDKGPYPYQWKICGLNPPSFIDYLTFHGPAVGGSESERKQHLCEQLRGKLRKAREAGKLT